MKWAARKVAVMVLLLVGMRGKWMAGHLAEQSVEKLVEKLVGWKVGI